MSGTRLCLTRHWCLCGHRTLGSGALLGVISALWPAGRREVHGGWTLVPAVLLRYFKVSPDNVVSRVLSGANISCHFNLLDLLVVGCDKYRSAVVLLADINKRHHCSRWSARILAAKDLRAN